MYCLAVAKHKKTKWQQTAAAYLVSPFQWMLVLENKVQLYKTENKQAVCQAHDMPPPLYAARCSPAPAHTCLTPAAGTQRALRHEYSLSTGSGSLWL